MHIDIVTIQFSVTSHLTSYISHYYSCWEHDHIDSITCIVSRYITVTYFISTLHSCVWFTAIMSIILTLCSSYWHHMHMPVRILTPNYSYRRHTHDSHYVVVRTNFLRNEQNLKLKQGPVVDFFQVSRDLNLDEEYVHGGLVIRKDPFTDVDPNDWSPHDVGDVVVSMIANHND